MSESSVAQSRGPMGTIVRYHPTDTTSLPAIVTSVLPEEPAIVSLLVLSPAGIEAKLDVTRQDDPAEGSWSYYPAT